LGVELLKLLRVFSLNYEIGEKVSGKQPVFESVPAAVQLAG